MGDDKQKSVFEQVDAIARQADPWPIHWLAGSDDASVDYCLSCCEAIAEQKADATVDGGWDDERESDGPSFCGKCGRLLGFYLTKYGFEEELDYWRHDDCPSLLSPNEAYEFQALLEAAETYGTKEEKDEVVVIGGRLLDEYFRIAPNRHHQHGRGGWVKRKEIRENPG